MKSVSVKRMPVISMAEGLGPVSELLISSAESEGIESLNWSDFPYKPGVSFRAGWNENGILIHYESVERRVAAKCMDTNGPVCRDSCVEFFVSDGDGGYFNFEFNAAGTRYAGYGTGRHDSAPLPAETVETIICEPKLSGLHRGIDSDETIWTLAAFIPLSIFGDTKLAAPAGRTFRANFYKCAEDTGAPHFLSWNPVNTPEPDFHRPEFFGSVKFE